ncbi:MAG: MATE family efflux transporter [Phycisphaerales bacterium]
MRQDRSEQRPVVEPVSEAIAPGEDAALAAAASPRRERGLGLTADGRLRAGRLAGMTMPAAIVALSWPVLVDSFLNSLVGLTDTVLAANISEAATDAIGGASYILWFIGLVFIALDVGATALISRAVGAGRLAVANAAVGQTMLLAVLAGAGVALLVAAMTLPMASLMGFTGEARDSFSVYLWIIAASVPCMAVLFAGIACLRGGGDSFRPMRTMIVVNVVNLVASWALAGVDLKTTTVVNGEAVTRTILANPFPFELGVAGIALGTLLAHAAGAGLILWALLRGSSGLRLRKRRLRPHAHTLRRIVRVGLPNFFETLGMWAGNFLVLLMVGWLGAGYVGTHILAIRVEGFSFQPGFAMGIAAATLAGQYLGARSPAMARRAVLLCMGVAVAIMGTAGLVFMLWPRAIVGVLSSQPTHLEVAPQLLFITGLFQVPFCISLVLRSAMRGAGDVRVVMWITWLTTYAVRLPAVYICSGVRIPLPGGQVLENPFGFEPSLAGLWWGLCIEIVVRAALFVARFVHGGWARQRV